jgi:hypothetical protein
MFAMVFVVARRALKEMRLFGDASSWIMAFCVALLSIIGFVRFLGSSEAVTASAGEPRRTGGLLDVILLPYMALAATILLVLLLLAVYRLFHGRELGRLLGGPTRKETAAKPGMQEGDYHQRETKPFEPSDRKQIIARKNGKAVKKLEGER